MNLIVNFFLERNVSGVTTYALHPGAIETDLWRHSDKSWFVYCIHRCISFALKTPEQGTQTTIYCAVDEKCADQSGLYYAECAEKTPSKAALNEEDARRLWDLSWKMVGLDEKYDPFVNSTKL